MHSKLTGAVVLAAGLAVAGCQEGQTSATAPDIPFAPEQDTSLTDPDNPAKVFRVDFAKVEAEYPLSTADLSQITQANLRALTQEQIDQIYGRLTAGPIPDGPFVGDLFFPKGDSLDSRLGEILGGIKGRLADAEVKKLEFLGRSLWKGKVFYRDERVLRNYIEDLTILKPLLGDDTDDILTTTIDRRSWLRVFAPKTDVWLLFPAKLYCGQSLVDSRRESIIIDYAYNDELPNYRRQPDALAGRKGLNVRDEIRMIRPGLYLGRAYINRVFLLNFTLYSAEIDATEGEAFRQTGQSAEDCWPGEQQRTVAIN